MGMPRSFFNLPAELHNEIYEDVFTVQDYGHNEDIWVNRQRAADLLRPEPQDGDLGRVLIGTMDQLATSHKRTDL